MVVGWLVFYVVVLATYIVFYLISEYINILEYVNGMNLHNVLLSLIEANNEH